MRLIMVFALAAFILVGCVPEYVEPPSPDPHDEVWLDVDFVGETQECWFDTDLLWEGWHYISDGDIMPDECDPCECAPAECALPSKVTVHASVCPGGGAASTFDAGESWDGSCAQLDQPIESGTFASVTFEPPTVAPCAPVSPAPAPAHRDYAYFARACAPKKIDGAPAGFLTCYPPQEDGTCWSRYPVMRKFNAILDTRTCTPCSCGAPSGGKCAVKTALYEDLSCRHEVGSEFVSDKDPPLCRRAGDGPIQSMRSVFTQNEPGTCVPSTDSKIAGGTVEPGERRVLCCRF